MADEKNLFLPLLPQRVYPPIIRRFAAIIPVLYRLSIRNLNNSLGRGCHLLVMGDEHNGFSLLMELLEQAHHFCSGLLIQVSGRFIG